MKIKLDIRNYKTDKELVRVLTVERLKILIWGSS